MTDNKHGRAAENLNSGVEKVRQEPAVVNQGNTPVVNSNVHGSDNNSRPVSGSSPSGSGTSGTTGTAGSGDTGGDAPAGNNGSSNETGTTGQQTPPAGQAAPAEVGDEFINDVLNIDDAGKQEEAIEDYAKKNGLEVSEVKRQVEKAKPTTNSAPKGSDGRENAGVMKGMMPDPDWGKPLDDKFDIQQGDFIEFLMKDVVLASASWTGNKVFGVTGYALYKGGSSAYHWVGDNLKKGWDKSKELNDKRKEDKKKNNEKINNENLYSGILKHDDKTNKFAKNVLDIRKEFLEDIFKSPEIKSAQTLCTYVRSTIRGEMDIDNAVRGKDGKYTVTRKYKDEQGKEQFQKITVDEKTFNTLKQVDENVRKALANGGDEKKLRQAMDEQITFTFENHADLLIKEKIFAADYAASVLIEKAAHMTPEEIGKLKTGKEFQNLLKGEGKLAFYHHLYDIEHRKPEAFKGKVEDGKEISALQVLSDTGHAALEQSVKKLNDSQYREAFKDKEKPVPENATLSRVFINGKSEYAPEVNEMTEQQREASLKYMQTDAIQGYNRLDQLNRQQQEIDGEISAIASDAKDAQQRKTELEQRKKSKTTEHDKGTMQRDAARSAAFNNIRGNTK